MNEESSSSRLIGLAESWHDYARSLKGDHVKNEKKRRQRERKERTRVQDSF